ncbi:VanZ family protein [uncultured Draconibacterium sp.]|uniref:VanZ family protein n=1 Tax=uncultured Draconibacterium sp. TaxID=1573823 RepID=UPI0025F26FBB|nr:VanZ family protein [uncultured Draconibacterium sp.]
MKIAPYWRLAIWLIIMSYLLFLPAGQLPSKPFIQIPHFDKLAHFGMFFILCLLTFRPAKVFTPNYYFWTPLLTLVAAVFLEYIQHKISPSRHSDIYDLWANAAGLSAATMFYALFVNKKWLEKVF